MSAPESPVKQQAPEHDTVVITEKSPVDSYNGNTDDANDDPIDLDAERRLLWKCDLHVIPVLFVLYMLSFLDRINIGNANIEGLPQELHLSGSQYNVALLIFFVPYILLEVPSNIIMKKVAPSTWLSLLLFLWGECRYSTWSHEPQLILSSGVATTCQGLVSNYGGLVACRFFLGVFEAGVFPGCAFLISMYYKRHELQKRWTFFFSSGLVAGAFGGVGLRSIECARSK